MLTAMLEKTRDELELNVAKLEQQLEHVSEQSSQNDRQLRAALQNEKLAHDADVDRLTADKVLLAHTTLCSKKRKPPNFGQ